MFRVPPRKPAQGGAGSDSARNGLPRRADIVSVGARPDRPGADYTVVANAAPCVAITLA
jgi:hypothetical protein